MKEAHVKKIRKKPLQCPHCEYWTNRKTYLNRHVEKRHNNNKPNFSCNICNKSFNRKDNLKRHIKTHEEKKLFSMVEGVKIKRRIMRQDY